MADDPSTPAAQEANPQPDNPNSQSNQPDSIPVSTPIPVNPNPNPPLVSLPPPPPPSVSYAPQLVSTSVAFAVPPAAPSFRPVPQFSPILNYQNPGVPPPGVSSGAPGAPVPVPVPQHMMHYQMQPMRPYAPMPNGYSAPPQGTIPPPAS